MVRGRAHRPPRPLLPLPADGGRAAPRSGRGSPAPLGRPEVRAPGRLRPEPGAGQSALLLRDSGAGVRRAHRRRDQARRRRDAPRAPGGRRAVRRASRRDALVGRARGAARPGVDVLLRPARQPDGRRRVPGDAPVARPLLRAADPPRVRVSLRVDRPAPLHARPDDADRRRDAPSPHGVRPAGLARERGEGSAGRAGRGARVQHARGRDQASQRSTREAPRVRLGIAGSQARDHPRRPLRGLRVVGPRPPLSRVRGARRPLRDSNGGAPIRRGRARGARGRTTSGSRSSARRSSSRTRWRRPT